MVADHTALLLITTISEQLFKEDETMKVDLQKTVTSGASTEQLFVTLQSWANEGKYETEQLAPGKWQFKRGGLVRATIDPSIYWDITHIPTLVSIEYLGGSPSQINCSMETSLPFRIVIGAKKKVENAFNDLLIRISNLNPPQQEAMPSTIQKEGTTELFCPACNTLADPGMKFCRECGTTLSPAPPAEPER